MTKKKTKIITFSVDKELKQYLTDAWKVTKLLLIVIGIVTAIALITLGISTIIQAIK